MPLKDTIEKCKNGLSIKLAGLLLSVTIMAGCKTITNDTSSTQSPFIQTSLLNSSEEIVKLQRFDASYEACPECWDKAIETLNRYELELELSR